VSSSPSGMGLAMSTFRSGRHLKRELSPTTELRGDRDSPGLLPGMAQITTRVSVEMLEVSSLAVDARPMRVNRLSAFLAAEVKHLPRQAP
jgi:hypothetical protein